VLEAFGDDSHDEKSERVFAVAGVVGRQCDWEELVPKWSERLEGRAFHAADCESDRKEFAGAPHEVNQQLYADLAGMLANSKIFGYSHSLDLTALQAVFGKGLLRDSPFYFCFTRVLVDCARYGYLSLPQEAVRFTFDRRRESEYNTVRLYELARKMKDWKYRGFLADEISFASRTAVGIQVADLLAREAMKALDRHVGESRPIRESLMTVLRGRRFKFRMYGRDYLEGLQRNLDTLNEPYTQADYHEWLRNGKLADNHSNRLKWLAHTAALRELEDVAVEEA
jgi:hypothetical protein